MTNTTSCPREETIIPLEFVMVKVEGLIHEYRVMQEGQTILKFNNPQMSIIFLLNELFPNEKEHYFNSIKEKLEVGSKTKGNDCP